MSTKVYEGYRLKQGVDPWEFAARVRKTALGIAGDAVLRVVAGLARDPKAGAAIMEGAGLGPGGRHEHAPESDRKFHFCLQAWWKVQDLYREATQGHVKHPFDYDISVNIWKRNGRYYLIPYRFAPAFRLYGGEDPLGFLAKDPDLEPYPYWNNTDRPDDVPAREWKRRGKAWDLVCDRWDDRLVLTVLAHDMFHRLPTYMHNPPGVEPPARQAAPLNAKGKRRKISKPKTRKRRAK